MLSGKEILKKFNSIIPRRRAIIITTAILIGLSSILPKSAHAVSQETMSQFKETYTLVREVAQESKKVIGGKVLAFEIPEKYQKEINKKMDKAMKSLEKDVMDDIKNQKWEICLKHLEILRTLAESYNQGEYEKRILDLIRTVNQEQQKAMIKKIEDAGKGFENVDTRIPGVYTVKGSNSIYCIGAKYYGKMKVAATAISLGEISAYLKKKVATTMNRNLVYIRNNDGSITSVDEVTGNIIFYDGTTITAKELAKRLEQEGRFLPLK